MADVEQALAQAAEEDGGPLFECRPRGLPPGRVGRILAVVVIVAPFLAGAWDLAGLWLRGRDHPRRWSVGGSSVQLHVDDERGVTHSAFVHGPAWGPASPFLHGVDVPWLLLGAVGFATLELLRLARYRSRRIVVTRTSVLVGEGIVGAHVHAWTRSERPTLVVRRGDVTLWSKRPLALGRLDPLDLIELAARVGAAPHPPAPPRSRRWAIGLAIAALVGVCALAGLVAPWRVALHVERGAGSFADHVTLTVDGPAWGPRRTVAPLHERSGPVIQLRGRQLADYLEAGYTSDFMGRPPGHFVACVVSALEADGQPVQQLTHALQGATNSGLRREEVTSLQLLEDSPTLGPRRRAVAPSHLRLEGRVRLVEGEPIPFDVTLAPGESVTLDLGERR